MKQDMKEFMAKVSEDEGLRVKLEALAGLPEDEVAARMAAIACEAGFEVAVEDLDPAETELDESELAAVSRRGACRARGSHRPGSRLRCVGRGLRSCRNGA